MNVSVLSGGQTFYHLNIKVHVYKVTPDFVWGRLSRKLVGVMRPRWALKWRSVLSESISLCLPGTGWTHIFIKTSQSAMMSKKLAHRPADSDPLFSLEIVICHFCLSAWSVGWSMSVLVCFVCLFVCFWGRLSRWRHWLLLFSLHYYPSGNIGFFFTFFSCSTVDRTLRSFFSY